MPKDDKSQSPSPPPRSLRSSSKEHHVSPAKPRSRSRSSELSIKRARSWSPRRDRSFSPRRRNSETFRDTGHAGREYDDRRLHVANLDVDTSKKDMEQVFGKYGPLKEIWLARSVPAFAFVIYRDRLDTLEALRKADRREICGRTIRVTIAHRSYHIERKGFGVDKIRNRFHCGDSQYDSRDFHHTSGYKRLSNFKGRFRLRGRYRPRGFYDDRRYENRK